MNALSQRLRAARRHLKELIREIEGIETDLAGPTDSDLSIALREACDKLADTSYLLVPLRNHPEHREALRLPETIASHAKKLESVLQ